MDWRLIAEQPLDGATAMALDEVAAETVTDGGPATVRLYRWTPSTLTLGYGTDIDEIDVTFCDDNGIDVTRRPTGGGAIYHDYSGDVAYSIIAPADAYPGDVTACYRQFCEPVVEAFDRVGVEVDFASTPADAIHPPACYLRALDPAHDITGPDGRKIAGNAQYRTRDAIVQHGSLTFDVDATMHVNCFSATQSPKTFRDRVGGVTDYADVDRSSFVDSLESSLSTWADAEPGSWTDAERERSHELVERKYGADEWILNREPIVQ
ncbi:MAG: lipoate--protein ligase family protein [Natronomonas sp.]